MTPIPALTACKRGMLFTVLFFLACRWIWYGCPVPVAQ